MPCKARFSPTPSQDSFPRSGWFLVYPARSSSVCVCVCVCVCVWWERSRGGHPFQIPTKCWLPLAGVLHLAFSTRRPSPRSCAPVVGAGGVPHNSCQASGVPPGSHRGTLRVFPDSALPAASRSSCVRFHRQERDPCRPWQCVRRGLCADRVSVGSRLLDTCCGGAQEEWALQREPHFLAVPPPPATAQVPWTGCAVWGQNWAFDLCYSDPSCPLAFLVHRT